MISISGLRDLTKRLSALDLVGARAGALAEAAEVIEQSLTSEGTGKHSLGITIEADRAVIGTADPAAADVELGSRATLPRPFWSQAAQVACDDAADIVAAHFVAALRGE